MVHYTLPQSLEGYYQETGRAGRDGGDAKCILLYSSDDYDSIKKWINDDGSQKSSNLDLMMTYCGNTRDCRRQQLMRYFSEKFNPSECNKTCDNCKNRREVTFTSVIGVKRIPSSKTNTTVTTTTVATRPLEPQSTSTEKTTTSTSVSGDDNNNDSKKRALPETRNDNDKNEGEMIDEDKERQRKRRKDGDNDD